MMRRSLKSPQMLARTAGAVLLGGWLCWQITTAGVAGLAERSLDPRLLAVTDPQAHPQAGSFMAQQLLVAGLSADAAATARSVVLVDPTNDRAMRVLGLATEMLGKRDAGAAIMRQAATLGWRDTPTQLWAIKDAAVRDDAVTVVQRADGLARRNRSGDVTRGIFLAALGEPRLRAALVDSLAGQPMWRGAFFADIHQRLPASLADGVETLFQDMRARDLAVTPVERLSYVDRLVDLGQVARAHRFWARSFAIPSDRLTRMPYDPRFTLAAKRPADTPTSRFEWMLNPDLAGTVTFGGDTGGSALAIPADITGGTVIASQVLILAPGTHNVAAQLGGSGSAAAAGWTITCLPSRQDIPRRISRGADDELSSVSFDVPAQACDAQQLNLVSRDRIDAQAVTIREVQVR